MSTEMEIAEGRLFQVLTNWQRDLGRTPRADMTFTDEELGLVVGYLHQFAESRHCFNAASPMSLMILMGVYLKERSELELLLSVLPIDDPAFAGLLRTFVHDRYDHAWPSSVYERKVGRFLQVLEGKLPRKLNPPKDWFADEDDGEGAGDCCDAEAASLETPSVTTSS